MYISVFIPYQLDPFKRAGFEEYARRWIAIIAKCGGNLVGYWMPHEGTNNVAFALISFENLGAYESYRATRRQASNGEFRLCRGKQIHPCREAHVPAESDGVVMPLRRWRPIRRVAKVAREKPQEQWRKKHGDHGGRQAFDVPQAARGRMFHDPQSV